MRKFSVLPACLVRSSAFATPTFLLLAAGAAAVTASAQTLVRPEFRTAPRALVVERVDPAHTVPTLGAVHGELAEFQDLGTAAGSLALEHIQLVLRRPAERQAAFDAAIDALHTPGNASYHQWLTPEAVGEAFSPAASDLAAVKAYLQGEGFTVNFIGKSGMVVDFSGTAAQVSKSFKTEIHALQGTGGNKLYAAVREAQLPAALAPVVVGFLSLSNISPHSQMHKVQPPIARNAGSLKPLDTVNANNGDYAVAPQDFYTIYNEGPLFTATTPITGSGITVALLEQTDIVTADVTAFRTTYGVTPNAAALTVAHGSTSVACSDPGRTGDEGEAILDTEWAGAVAPGATLLYMSCAAGSTAGIFLSAEAVIDDNLAPIMSLSYGSTEVGNGSGASFFVNLWEQAAAQGQTVVISAGDDGSGGTPDQNQAIASHGLAVNNFASTAYNVAAGGTDFQDAYNGDKGDTAYGQGTYWNATNSATYSSAKSYIPEMPWNGTCASSMIASVFSVTPNAFCDSQTGSSFYATAGGGGGASIYHPRPSWQTGTVFGLPANSGVFAARLLPDISLFASAGPWGHTLVFYQSDSGQTVSYAGGTSFVAPQLAGMFALIAQKTSQRLGQPNYELYSLAGTAYGTTTFAGSSCNGSGASGIGTTSSSPAGTCVFYDVQTGNNAQGCTTGTLNCYTDNGTSNVGIFSLSTTSAQPAYASGQGYDMATGIGSTNITNLVNAWVNATITPTTPTVLLTTAPSPYVYGSPSVYFAGSTSGTNSNFAPTGSMTLGVGGTSYGTYALTASDCSGATCTANFPSGLGLTYGSPIPAGATISLSSTYTSNSLYYNNATFSGSFTVQKQTPTVATGNIVTTAGAISQALSASVTYTGSGTVPSNGLTFKIDGGTATAAACSGSASPLTCTLSVDSGTLTVGSHTINASYAGDTNYNTTSGTGVLTVGYGIWLVNASGSAYEVSETGALVGSAGSGGAISALGGAAFDSTGNLWSVTSANTTLMFSAVGTNAVTAYSGGGLSTPVSVAVDGAGGVWVANAGNSTVSAFTNGGTAHSGPVGWGTGMSAPSAIALDGAGSVWVANKTGNSVTHIFGAATPVVAPLSKGVVNGTLGTKP